MPKWAWIAVTVAVVGIIVWYFLPKQNTQPSGNIASQPATLNPTVATTSFGK